MKRNDRLAWFYPITLFVLGIVLTCAGCAQEIGQQLLAERRIFNTTLGTIHTAHVVGALPAAQEKQLLPFLEATRASLDAGDSAYAAKDVKTADIYSQAAVAGLEKLKTILSATTQPTTKPTK